MKQVIELDVNGETHELVVQPRRTLLEVLRTNLGLTGAKDGCGMGECGACTILLDGKAVNSCLILAVRAQGKKITTIEGLSPLGQLDPIQQAFIEHGAIQCGICIPGMIMTAKGLLMQNPSPTEEEVREALAGTICRCTGYKKIVQAVMSVGSRQ